MSTRVTATRDFTDNAGKTYKAGDPVTDMTQPEINQRTQSGEVREENLTKDQEKAAQQQRTQSGEPGQHPRQGR